MVRARSLFTRATTRFALLVAVAAIGLAVAIFVPRASDARYGGQTTVMPLTRAFALLRQSPSAPPPPAIVSAVSRAPGSFGLDVASARRSANTGAWLIPGSGWLCIAVEDSDGLGVSCTSTASAERGELAFQELSAGTGIGTVVGATPDWISHVQISRGQGATEAGVTARESTYAATGVPTTGPMHVSEGIVRSGAGE